MTKTEIRSQYGGDHHLEVTKEAPFWHGFREDGNQLDTIGLNV